MRNASTSPIPLQLRHFLSFPPVPGVHSRLQANGTLITHSSAGAWGWWDAADLWTNPKWREARSRWGRPSSRSRWGNFSRSSSICFTAGPYVVWAGPLPLLELRLCVCCSAQGDGSSSCPSGIHTPPLQQPETLRPRSWISSHRQNNSYI